METVTRSDRPVPQLYNETASSLEDAGLNFVVNLPSLPNIQHGLYSRRNKSMKVTKTVFKSLEEVEVPDLFSFFVLADYFYDGARILVFCSEKARELLQNDNITEYFIDSTFSSCPKPFAQLFSVLGDAGSTTEFTNVLPLIFALLPDKKESTYKTLFQLIKSQLPDWSPKKLHCDYEIAAINAIRDVIPDVQIIGCFYHWSRALWRKAKMLGVVKSKAQKRIISLTVALALLPQEYMSEGWDYIKTESEIAEIDSFTKYIEKFWIKKNLFKILNVFAQRHRTNNAIEGWHSKLNKMINKNTVTLLRLLNILKKFAAQAIAKQNQRSRRKRCLTLVRNDEFIMQVQLELLNSDINVGHALDKLR